MAIQLGGTSAPNATATTQTMGNPNKRIFNVTWLDADVGPTTFNHGLLAAPQLGLYAVLIPQVTVASTAQSYPAVTWTLTGVTITKLSAVGSGGASPGTTVVQVLVIINLHSIAA